MTITLTREEAQQVLEHLDDLVEAQQWEIDMHITQYGEEYKPHRVKHMMERLASTNGTIETLRARLSAPEPEPVAWMDEEGFTWAGNEFPHEHKSKCKPLYTAPPQREWQGLTDEEITVAWNEAPRIQLWVNAFARAIEAKLKEKNAQASKV